MYKYSRILLRFCLSHRVLGPNFLWHSSSLNLRSTHCTLCRFSLDMFRVWNSFPVELRTDYNSLHEFQEQFNDVRVPPRHSTSAMVTLLIEFGAV